MVAPGSSATSGEAVAFRLLGGTGPDCLLLHGFGADRMSWLANIPALLPICRLHALDLPGHGESSFDVGRGSLDELTDRVLSAVVSQGLQRMHIMAHSLGGAVAMLLAARQPAMVASLTLIAPLGLGRGVAPEFLKRLTDCTDTGEALTVLRMMVAQPQVIGPQVAERLVGQLDREGARQALSLIAGQISQPSASLSRAVASLAQSALPRLTVLGARDAINPLDQASLAAFGGGCEVIEAAGHLPHIEQARAFNAIATTFLSAQSATETTRPRGAR